MSKETPMSFQSLLGSAIADLKHYSEMLGYARGDEKLAHRKSVMEAETRLMRLFTGGALFDAARELVTAFADADYTVTRRQNNAIGQLAGIVILTERQSQPTGDVESNP